MKRWQKAVFLQRHKVKQDKTAFLGKFIYVDLVIISKMGGGGAHKDKIRAPL